MKQSTRPSLVSPSKILLLTFVLAAGLHTAGRAQQMASVAGELIDLQSGKPVRGFVLLYNDSTLQGGAYADSLGRFKIDHVPYGAYSIRIKKVGYKEQIKPVQVSQKFTRLGDLAINKVPRKFFGAVLWKRRRMASMYF